MIVSVEEAVEYAMREVWPDWVDADDRMIVWATHCGMSIFHCGHCAPEYTPEDCDETCPGGGVSCCCHHHIAPSVAITMTVLPPEDSDGVITPKNIAVPPLSYEMCATPGLERVLVEVRRLYEERQVLSNLSDVEMSMKAILDGEK